MRESNGLIGVLKVLWHTIDYTRNLYQKETVEELIGQYKAHGPIRTYVFEQLKDIIACYNPETGIPYEENTEDQDQGLAKDFASFLGLLKGQKPYRDDMFNAITQLYLFTGRIIAKHNPHTKNDQMQVVYETMRTWGCELTSKRKILDQVEIYVQEGRINCYLRKQLESIYNNFKNENSKIIQTYEEVALLTGVVLGKSLEVKARREIQELDETFALESEINQ